MYISKMVLVDKKSEYIQIYMPNQNTTLLVSNDIYSDLMSIYNKYGTKHLDTKDEALSRIISKKEYRILLKYGVFSDEPDQLSSRYTMYEPSLKTAYLHVTQECNLRCTYCYAKDNLGKNMMMSFCFAKKYIDILVGEGVDHFVLTGGEPLLNPDLGLIVDYIKTRANAKIDLLSNGTLLEENKHILYRVDNCIISLDVEGSLMRRGVSPSFVFSGLLSLPEEIREKVTVRSVISKGEEVTVQGMRQKIESLGFRYISIPRLPNCPEDLTQFPDPALIEEPEELIKTLKMVRCGAATAELAIDWNGDVYPCQSLMKKEHIITNLNANNWRIEWKNSEIRTVLRKAHVLNIEKCRECDMRFVCGGGCRALSYNVYNEYNHCLDFYCAHFKKYAMEKLSKVTFCDVPK